MRVHGFVRWLAVVVPLLVACGSSEPDGEGGADAAGGGTGTGGSSAGCASCTDAITGSTVSELCGNTSGGSDLACEPGTSCEFFENFVTCACDACGQECASSCTDDAPFDAACESCLDTTCASQTMACEADPGTGG